MARYKQNSTAEITHLLQKPVTIAIDPEKVSLAETRDRVSIASMSSVKDLKEGISKCLNED